MVTRSTLTNRKQTLQRKLLGYMLILSLFLFILLFSGMFLILGFTGTKKRMFQTLDFQKEVFKRQVTSHYDGLAVMGIQLSETSTWIIENCLARNDLTFDRLNGKEDCLADLQESLLTPLQHKLLETDCTGAFIILDTEVNPSVKDSRTGLYLQRSTLDKSDSHILLYRGPSDLGKKYGCMPHRKWRLEFNINQVPNYEELMQDASLPLVSSYRVTDMVVLSGTSERVMLMTIPIIGSSGTVYGLCGFEINESYFKHIFSQPSELDRAVFCLNMGDSGLTDPSDSFSAGILNGYYLMPCGEFRSASFGKELQTYKSDRDSYVGISEPVALCPGNREFSLSVLIPRQDYDQIASEDRFRIGLLIILFVSAAAGCCIYFSRSYLKPIKASMQRIRQKEYAEANSSIAEIDDLFAFLAEQDRIHEAAFNEMKMAKDGIQSSLEQIRTSYDETVEEVKRLAYSRKDEVDPDDYEIFKDGLCHLTVREKEIFDLYISGKKVKEIMELTGLKEPTIRFHNRNIYSKLGVHSLKQLLRYAAILKQEQ